MDILKSILRKTTSKSALYHIYIRFVTGKLDDGGEFVKDDPGKVAEAIREMSLKMKLPGDVSNRHLAHLCEFLAKEAVQLPDIHEYNVIVWGLKATAIRSTGKPLLHPQ